MANTWAVDGGWGGLPETAVLTDGDRFDWHDSSVALLTKQTGEQSPGTSPRLYAKWPLRCGKGKGEISWCLSASNHIARSSFSEIYCPNIPALGFLCSAVIWSFLLIYVILDNSVRMWHNRAFRCKFPLLKWLKTVWAFFKITMCFAKVKISIFNPAFVVPKEHLESLKEHFHRCWVHMLLVRSQCLQPCKREPQQWGAGPKTPHCHKLYHLTRVKQKLPLYITVGGCFCVEHKDTGMLTKSLQPTGSNLPVIHLWLMEDLRMQLPVSFEEVFIIPEVSRSTRKSHTLGDDGWK